MHRDLGLQQRCSTIDLFRSCLSSTSTPITIDLSCSQSWSQRHFSTHKIKIAPCAAPAVIPCCHSWQLDLHFTMIFPSLWVDVQRGPQRSLLSSSILAAKEKDGTS